MTVLMSSSNKFVQETVKITNNHSFFSMVTKPAKIGFTVMTPKPNIRNNAEHSTHAVLLVVTEMLNPLHSLEGDHLKQMANNRGNIHFVTDSV